MAEIAHSIYGASSSARYLACNMAPLMSKGIHEKPNEHAERGTAGHSLGEFCLRLNINTYDCMGMVFNKTKDFPNGFIVDQKLADGVQVYVSYIRTLANHYGVKPLLEKRVILLSVRNDVFGTSDCIFIIGDTLYVIDYKNGFGIVNVANNSQLIFYAIATLDTYGLWGQIRNIKTVVVQPNADHVEGSIRQHGYTVEELRAWVQVFRKAILNPDKKPVAGEHCKYCPASPRCRERMMRTIQLCYQDKPQEFITEAELEIVFRESKTIKNYLQYVEDKMLEYSRLNNPPKGFKLVSGRKQYICTDEEGLIEEAKKNEIDLDLLFDKKLKSKSKLNTIIGKPLTDKYFEKPASSSTLVPITDSRPALSNSAAGIFEKVN